MGFTGLGTVPQLNFQKPDESSSNHPGSAPCNTAISPKQEVPRPISEINAASGELTISEMQKPSTKFIDSHQRLGGTNFPQSQQLKHRQQISQPYYGTGWAGATSQTSDKSLPMTHPRTSMNHLTSLAGDNTKGEQSTGSHGIAGVVSLSGITSPQRLHTEFGNW